jgi:hypothetical protein
MQGEHHVPNEKIRVLSLIEDFERQIISSLSTE